MPTILRSGAYRFSFFSNEGREPPHIHVNAHGNQAKFWLTPVSLAWSYGFNTSELTRLRAMVEEHREQFQEAWYEHHPD